MHACARVREYVLTRGSDFLPEVVAVATPRIGRHAHLSNVDLVDKVGGVDGDGELSTGVVETKNGFGDGMSAHESRAKGLDDGDVATFSCTGW